VALWYVGHEDEFLIDIDEYMKPLPVSGAPWGEIFFRRRLRDAIEDGILDVRDVWLYVSNGEGRYHAIVRLNVGMPLYERILWQMDLGGDSGRGRHDLMRAIRGVECPTLLIVESGKAWPNFYRQADFDCRASGEKCTVKGKHGRPGLDCSVIRRLRPDWTWSFFSKWKEAPSGGNVEEYTKLEPGGLVPLELIMRRIMRKVRVT
jgi:hypothetical protein